MQTNVGLDLAFFNNALTTNIDWYLKDTKDMLTIPPVLSVAGENAERYMNTGVYEIEKADILRLDQFRKLGSPGRIVQTFGGKAEYLKAVQSLKAEIYKTG